jgi:hypothetical protein
VVADDVRQDDDLVLAAFNVIKLFSSSPTKTQNILVFVSG